MHIYICICIYAYKNHMVSRWGNIGNLNGEYWIIHLNACLIYGNPVVNIVNVWKSFILSAIMKDISNIFWKSWFGGCGCKTYDIRQP